MRLLRATRRPRAGRTILQDLRALDLARATGVPVPAVSRWLEGDEPGGVAQDRLATLAGLADRLEAAGLDEAELRGEWLRAPNPAFAGDAPLDLIAAGREAELLRYVAVLS